MRISVFGLGYVGTVCAACFAERGHTVIGVDPNPLKTDPINAGRSPIVEQDLDRLIREAVAAGRLRAADRAAEAIAESDLSFICVGTPSRPNGSLDLRYVRAVADELGAALRAKATRHLIVLRSTVLPGTTAELAQRLEAASGRRLGEGFGLLFHPEFLRESTAVEDFRHPPKTVIGAFDPGDAATLASLYAGMQAPLKSWMCASPRWSSMSTTAFTRSRLRSRTRSAPSAARRGWIRTRSCASSASIASSTSHRPT